MPFVPGIPSENGWGTADMSTSSDAVFAPDAIGAVAPARLGELPDDSLGESRVDEGAGGVLGGGATPGESPFDGRVKTRCGRGRRFVSGGTSPVRSRTA